MKRASLLCNFDRCLNCFRSYETRQRYNISFLTLNFQSVRSFYEDFERLYEVLVLIVMTLMTEHLVSFLVCKRTVTCI